MRSTDATRTGSCETWRATSPAERAGSRNICSNCGTIAGTRGTRLARRSSAAAASSEMSRTRSTSLGAGSASGSVSSNHWQNATSTSSLARGAGVDGAAVAGAGEAGGFARGVSAVPNRRRNHVLNPGPPLTATGARATARMAIAGGRSGGFYSPRAGTHTRRLPPVESATSRIAMSTPYSWRNRSAVIASSGDSSASSRPSCSNATRSASCSA